MFFFPGQVQVHRDHVLRAWKLLQILHIMRDYWSKTEEDGAKGIVLPPASADLQSRVPEHIKCPQSQGLDHFPATQRFEPKPEIPSEDEATPTPKECLTGKAFDAAMAKGYNVSTIFSAQPFRSCRTMSDNMVVEQAWALVENHFDLQELFGEVGRLFLEEQAAKKCLHTMAISMSVLAGLAPLANGAQVRIWSEPTPLVLATVLINPPQSRKSQTTSLLRELGTVIDQTCHERERARVLQRHPAAEEDIQTETLASNVLEGFTPEASGHLTQSLIDTDT
jgi:hypothetical protein